MSLWGKVKKAAKKVKKAVKKAVKKVKNAVKKVIKIAKDIVHRVLGVLDFLGTLIGIRPRKHLRLKVYILSKNGAPVQKPAHVEVWVKKAIEVMDKRANVGVRKPNLYLEMIDIIKEDAPDYVLNPPNYGFINYFRDAADWFEDHTTYARTSAGGHIADWLGYGEPVYAFVVDQIQNNKSGSVYWWGANYCILSHDAPLTTMAHEIGHVCGLLHWNRGRNLMSKKRNKSKDDDLNRLQVAWLRNSRFVVFLPRRG